MFKTVGELKNALGEMSDDMLLEEELAIVMITNKCAIVPEISADEDLFISDHDIDRWQYGTQVESDENVYAW